MLGWWTLIFAFPYLMLFSFGNWYETVASFGSTYMTGRYLTMLPMEPKLGKMLILGAILNCLDPVVTVVAGLSVRDPFLTPLDKKDVSQLCFYPIHLS